MSKIMVLGCGLVGKHIVTDIAENEKNYVIAIDNFGKPAIFNKYKNIHFESETINPDVIKILLNDFRPDAVVNALPGKIGFSTLEALIKSDRSPDFIVDISFMPENPLTEELQQIVFNKGMVVVTDFGIAPGISHAVLAFEKSLYPDLDRYECAVGGNPSDIKSNIWRYKAPFSPRDVIEEYTRPARYISVGEKRACPSPLFSTANVNIPRGPCQNEPFSQFISDGLRSLIDSYPKMESMTEWTIRHNDHLAQMQWLDERGFFDKGVIEYTAKTLINAWTLHEDEEDWLYMHINMSNDGAPAGTPIKRITYEFYDEYTNGVPAMARTTGYACNAVVNILMTPDRHFLHAGMFAPERFIQSYPDYMNKILQYIGDRGIKYRRTSWIGDIKSSVERGW